MIFSKKKNIVEVILKSIIQSEKMSVSCLPGLLEHAVEQLYWQAQTEHSEETKKCPQLNLD
jgi:hypothetical protein